MRRASVLVVITGLIALPAGAPPPVSAFPTELRPIDGGAAPPNARVFVFGEDAPEPDEIVAAMSSSGQPIAATLSALGDDAVVLTPDSELPEGANVYAVVSAIGGDVSGTFTVAGPVDQQAPALLGDVVVIDSTSDSLVLGAEGSDDNQLAGFLARASGAVVGAAPDGFALIASVGTDRCVEVTAFDVAGNESPPTTVCDEQVPEDDTDADGEGDEEDESGGSGGCAGGGSAAFMLLPLVRWRRP